ncbi:unnamed protein product [Aphanomyces euteiches]|uniref:NAD-dependent epimerase/dehydratase domain-containing protein n=1 Tax=Aphanomyces euteiches TaxID=100861 RepID=A0A6G0WZT0_9STRA|nr:hypothetical protein Ae201684_009899 [Aphanomyces euteiches]KAH9095848.1 hypothetical protein Ae201684P_010059 [Aphanomyces euteiches]
MPEKRVLVTGAAGFVASHVIKELLTTTDFIVRGTVRNLRDKSKYSHLSSLTHASTRLELVQADLLDADSWPAAVDGCFAVMHIASPYVMTVRDPLKDLVEPAVTGTANVLTTALAVGIQHLIVTSSIAAVTDSPARGKTYTEEDWNTTSSLSWLPYYYSKTRAEKKAWELVRAASTDVRLVVLNPAMVIGPSMTNTLNESVGYVVDPILGNVPMLIEISWALVDVRDVATAHVRALTSPTASGRYILVRDVWTMTQVVEYYRNRFPGATRLPRLSAPDWAARAFARLKPPGPKQYLQANLGYGKYAFSNAKSVQELGMTYRPIEDSLEDTIKNGIAWGFMPRSSLGLSSL